MCLQVQLDALPNLIIQSTRSVKSPVGTVPIGPSTVRRPTSPVRQRRQRSPTPPSASGGGGNGAVD